MDREEASDDPALNLPGINTSNDHSRRLPLSQRFNPDVRNHFVAMLGEFVGTFFFLFMGLSGAQAANIMATPDEQIPRFMYISLAFGFSLAVNVWVMFRVSGGLFNPAVTAGMCLVSAVPWVRGGLLIISQVLAGIVSSLVVSAIFPGPLALTKLNTDLGINGVQGFVIELFLTFQLVLSIMMMAGEKNAATHMAPVGIGIALFVSILSGAHFTGGSLNPARSFGPALVAWDFTGEHWIYWAGPFGGAILAAGTYKFLKILEYEKANPGQDHHLPKPGSVRI